MVDFQIRGSVAHKNKNLTPPNSFPHAVVIKSVIFGGKRAHGNFYDPAKTPEPMSAFVTSSHAETGVRIRGRIPLCDF